MTRVTSIVLSLAGAALLSATPALAQATAQSVIGSLNAQCTPIIYEQDCYAEIRKATAAALTMGEEDQKTIGAELVKVVEGNPGNATRIRELITESGLEVENL